MRIEFVTDTFAPDVNGVAMTLGRLVAGLRERGHLVHVWHTAERQEESGETSLPSISLPGYKQVRLGLPGRLKLLRRWRRKAPDVVYVATESLLGLSAIKAAAMLRIPVAAGFHTNFDEYLEQYHLPKLKGTAMSYLRKVHNQADCTFAPSREVVAKLETEGFRDVHLLGRGVDAFLFNPSRRDAALRADWGAGETDPVLLMVGRLAAEKNLELGIRAFHRILEHFPTARCVVVGDGPLGESLAQKHPEVIFAGVRREMDLARHYASADVLLFPSQTETFGNVLLEGMASGLSTVSFDYAAAALHVRSGENGRKAALGDDPGFITHSLAAAADSMGGALRKEARESVLTMDWGQVVMAFEKRLQGLTGGRANARGTSIQKPGKMAFRTVFVSDIHLGTADSKVKEVIDFLKHCTFEKLVLNGDIIDGWALKRGGTWKKSHSKFVRYIFKLMESQETEVVYLRGNHDDILDRFLPMAFGPMTMVKEHIHRALNGKRYLVVHGDGFDTISTRYKWAAVWGAIGYDQLMKVNRLYNRYRSWRGMEYFSMSQAIKGRVKSAVSFVDRYQEQLQLLARRKGCDGIICGHIHTPADEDVDGIHYLNSGDWVESLSAVVEHPDGRFEVLYYEDFLQRIHDLGKVEPLEQVVDLAAAREVSGG